MDGEGGNRKGNRETREEGGNGRERELLIYVLFPGDYLSVISCYYQVLVEVPPTSAVCLDHPCV